MSKTNQNKKELDLFGPLFLMIIGAVLLLNTTDYVTWQIWVYVAKFWPVLLIIWGFETITEKNYNLKLLVSLLGAAVVITIFTFGYQNTQHIEENKDFSLEVFIKDLVDKD